MSKLIKGKAVFSWTLFILKYWAVLILVFQISRIVFFGFNLNDAKAIGPRQALLAAWYGLTMDISMASYIMLPFLLFMMLAVVFRQFRKPVFFQVYTGMILFLLVFFLIVDLAMFKSWGFRLDATPLKYISHPQEAWASIQHQPVGWILLVLFLGGVIAIRLNNGFINHNFAKINSSAGRILTFVSLLLLLGISIIPIRGGLQLAPINQSSVYFSSQHFANQSALNGPWNLLNSLTRKTNEKENPYTELSNHEAEAVLDTLYKKSSVHESLFTTDSFAKPNVIVIIWEGLTAKVIDSYYEGKAVTPNFNELKKEGVYFSNLYATGDRTDKGLVAVLSGYPSNPRESILKVPLKAAKLPMLSKEFQKRKYHTSFYYGGETEFANMKAYLLQGGFETIVSIDDFEEKDKNSKWGAHDDVVMQRIVEDISKRNQPFFTTWLTLSSHEPFEVPARPVFQLINEESQYQNSLHYTDSVFGAFIQHLKSSPLWQNTIILTIADHGSRMPKTTFKAEDFKIGALILGGPVKRSKVLDGIGNQVDIAGLLSHQLNFEGAVFPWSRNLLDSTGIQWTFFSFNDGFGYTEPLGTVIYDNVGKRVIQKRGIVGELQLTRGKALQQSVFQDYLDK